jgi:AMMECR1 domain-containing protein
MEGVLMNPYIQQQVENMIDQVDLFAKGCHKAALKDDLTLDVAEQYTIATIERLSDEFIKGLKKIY